MKNNILSFLSLGIYLKTGALAKISAISLAVARLFSE
jgi:hypothetical protein